MNREEFVQGLYDDAEEELKEIYKQQSINMDELLNEIAMILLAYTIVDNVLNLNNKQKNTLYKGLSSKILNMFSRETKETTKKVNSILSKVAKDNLESYGIKFHRQEVLDIINRNLDGKHYSDRIWDNENEVSKRLHKEVKDFLDGKVNANQIKSKIEKQFNANKYNVGRLVDTEIARVESDVTEKYFRDYGIKKVKYNACLCNTCDKCMSNHNRTFDIDDPDRPRLPRHPKCHCFYVQGDDASFGALSGALTSRNDPDFKRRDEHAKKYYNSVRKRNKKEEISSISNNTGVNPITIEKVYNHIFINKYDLNQGHSNFAPDYDMAQSWQSLRSGKNIQEHDLIMLKHERLEYELMSRYNKTYEEAHRLTERKYNYAKELIKYLKKNNLG